MVDSSEMGCWMKLAAAVLVSGYKEKDKRFLEGDCKWWHDDLVEGLRDWNATCDRRRAREASVSR